MKNIRKSFFLFGSSFVPLISSAQEEQVQNTVSYLSNPLFDTLLAVIIILAIMVITLSGALKNIIGSSLFIEKIKKEKENNSSAKAKSMGLLIGFLLLNFASLAEDKVVKAVADDRISGLDKTTFFVMLITIVAELLVLGILFNTFKNILGEKKAKVSAQLKPKTKSILDQLNDTVELEKEESIMLDHDYDGIKELDNNLPPWWKYGFYFSIVVAFIYMINYHITKTSPLQAEEYTNSVKEAEAEIAEYMKTSANNVDESTVKRLTEASDLNAGKDIFIATCSACHGKLGEGTVGPNLTDEYWMHGGGVSDVFKTIKYGWPDKGMKSWKDEYSPIQMAQLASYILTLKGTNPPNAKDKQGDLYMETEIKTDSTSVKADSTKTIASEIKK